MPAWSPLTDLSPSERAFRDSEAEGLRLAWRDQRDELASEEARRQFELRHGREWAIETGVIEGVYQIDRGITEVLIARGIDAALIPHGMAFPSGEFAARMAATHEEVLEGLFAFVKGERTLTTGYLKELHASITRDQEWAEGRDALGKRAQVPLTRGEYKAWPNNPTRRNGTLHEYAPPVHVAAEMDSLVELADQHAGTDVDPLVAAAWLHHRFTQIHPFQDGNGRVARALASIVLIRAGGLPLVVTRDMRADYIAALEAADAGDLTALITLIGRRQAEDTVRALVCLPRPSEALVAKLAGDWLALRKVAERLVEVATDSLAALGTPACETSATQPPGPRLFVDSDATRVATLRGQRWAGRPPAWWARAEWPGRPEGRLSVWVQEVGHPYRGLMAAGALVALTDSSEPEPAAAHHALGQPFFLSYREERATLVARFQRWLEAVLADGRSHWSEAQG